MNKVILVGNLTKDFEMRRTSAGKVTCSNTVAVNRTFKTEDGGYSVDYIDIVIWGKQAEFAERYLKKGTKVELCGEWRIRYYSAKDGSERKVSECLVESIRGVLNARVSEQEANNFLENSHSVPYAVDEDEKPAAKPKVNNDPFDDLIDDDLPF